MDARRTGRIFGWFFIGTFVVSIPARILFVDGLGASWDDMRFVPGAGSETTLKLAAMLEFALIFFNIATAVVVYPLLRRQSETVSLGYVTARIMESVFIASSGTSCTARASCPAAWPCWASSVDRS